MDTTLREQLASQITPELIAVLDKMFPLATAVPTETASERAIWIRVGEQRVVELMRAVLQEARDNPMQTPLLNNV